MSNPDIKNREQEGVFSKQKEERVLFPRFSALASKKHEVMFDKSMSERHYNFINLLKEKYSSTELKYTMSYHAGMSTPPKDITCWDFEGEDSIERFLYKNVLEKKSKELLNSEFVEKYFADLSGFSKKLLEQSGETNQMEALNIATGFPKGEAVEIFDTPDFEISTFVDQEYEKYFSQNKK